MSKREKKPRTPWQEHLSQVARRMMANRQCCMSDIIAEAKATYTGEFKKKKAKNPLSEEQKAARRSRALAKKTQTAEAMQNAIQSLNLGQPAESLIIPETELPEVREMVPQHFPSQQREETIIMPEPQPVPELPPAVESIPIQSVIPSIPI